MKFWKLLAQNKVLIISVLALIAVFIIYSLNKEVGQANLCQKLPFIDPSLDCNTFDAKGEQMDKLQTILEQQIKGLENTDAISQVGVFARDMQTQKFVGINENIVFDMASLLKVPLAIAYYKYSEVNPEVLNSQEIYNPDPKQDFYSLQMIQPSNKLQAGNSYSIQDLIERMLKYSDNAAASILINRISPDLFGEILKILNISFNNKDTTEDLVTAKTYANIFRILYNSSYLTRENSNAMLAILSESDYKNGAMAKLPPSLVVAHKFGEREQYNPKTGALDYIQLHDCGLVYLTTNNAYTFCIMTQGNDLNQLQTAIQDISLTIYNNMRSN